MSLMTTPARLALLALSTLTLAACSQQVEDTHPDKPVTQRQEAFKAMLRTFEPMGTMLRTDRYDADTFARMAVELKALRDKPWAHFGADTNYPPTKARPAVWQKTAEFERRRDDFIATSDGLFEAAEGRNAAEVRRAYEAVQDSCKACHRDFRR